MKRALVRCIMDAGPLVALFSRSDRRHAWVAKKLRGYATPVLTSDGVIVETQHILGRAGLSAEPLFKLLEGGTLLVLRPEEQAVLRTVQLCRLYSSVPMAWADACLVQLSELHRDARICSFDNDFTVYRRFSKEPIPLDCP